MSASLGDIIEFVRRWPYCVACGVLTIALGAASWYLHGEIGRLELILRDRSKEGEEMLSQLVGGSTLRQELAEAKAIGKRIDDNLVIEDNLAENSAYFYKIEEQTRAHLPDFHQVSSPTTDKSPLFRRVPYGLRVTGTYEQVASFLLALETGPRLVKITNFTMARMDPAGLSVSLDLNIELLGKK